MKCEFGYCLHCEKEIANTCENCGAKKPNEKYTEVALKLSNGSKIFVATCLDCMDAVFAADKTRIMEAIKDGWRAEAFKHGRHREPTFLKNLEESWKDLKVVD